ncbi:class I SAM-dependent methyltransferase [Ramlibacter albus]|uniref:Methyltransferase regulatory domain-containing protein n=1 Tax=Ramlibacter albus TaxID=2079448 RepID=A0A923M6P0_9BURK|nr:class I SAM-dependent methyltransferase [Ramlibacter albus]MBC5764791.1 methyltransferase regulatory domain-containing protein [Ramlibacter albus]
MKRDWADGYVSDITYSHGYFHELAPAYLRYHLLVNGRACPSDGGRYTYCELGFGQGVSANIHAAANPRGEFWGTDFNPDHVLNARSLAHEGGLQAHWHGDSFEDFLDASTPHFDFIVLHGVWSWVSPAAQHALVEIMRRKLKPGGLVYISYNVLPGWNAEKPLRDLLFMHAEHEGAPDAPTPERIANALQFARALRRHGCAFFTDNARASKALDDMLRQEPGSLAHEYFNSSWWLTYFADVERTLQAASLRFACSVHMSDVSGEVRERLAGSGLEQLASGMRMRETAADFVLGRRFRRDIFMRGSVMLTPSQRWAMLDEVAFVPLRPAAEVGMFLTTPYGQMAMDESRLRPLLQRLGEADGAITLAELRGIPELEGWSPEDLVLHLSRLVARRDIAPVFADDAACATASAANEMNMAIATRALHGDSLRYLASPVAGAGVDAGRHDRLFWLAWHEGARTAPEIARAVAPWCGETAEALERRAEPFITHRAPVWRRLGLT